MSEDIINYYKNVPSKEITEEALPIIEEQIISTEEVIEPAVKKEIVLDSNDPFRVFLNTLADNLEKRKASDFKELDKIVNEEVEEIVSENITNDPFAKFLSNVAGIIKKDEKIQTDEQIKEATIGFINKLKNEPDIAEKEETNVKQQKKSYLPKRIFKKVPKKTTSVTVKEETIDIPQVDKKHITETEKQTNTEVDNTYVKELKIADNSKKVSDKITKPGDIKILIEKQVREQINKLRSELNQASMTAGGGGTVAVQYANGGTMNGDLNVTGRYLSGGIDLTNIFSGGGGGSSDRLISGSSSLILNSNGTLQFPNNTIRSADDTEIILESENTALSAYTQIALTPHSFTTYNNGGDSITFDSISNTIEFKTADSYTWTLNDQGYITGPSNTLNVNGSINTTSNILSGGKNLDQIFITYETDSQTLNYIPSSYNLSISNGNTVSLASLSSKAVDLSFLSVSGDWQATYSTVSSLSANWNTAYQTVSAIPYTFIASTSSIDTVYGNNNATGIFSGSLGGNCNLASGNYSFIGGGNCNTASGIYSLVSNGELNTASGAYSIINGGLGNYNPLRDSVIGGGVANHTGGFAPYNITAAASISGNGSQTRLTGSGIQTVFSSPFTSNNVSVYYSTPTVPLSSGCFTTATIAATGTNFVIINGDYSTCTSSGLSATSIYVYDRSINNTGYDNFIGGGKLNTASGLYSFVGGGVCNTAAGNNSLVVGGIGNTSCGFGGSAIVSGNVNNITNLAGYAFIAGGRSNTISNWYSAIGGGSFNSITGQNAVVAGGSSNIILSNGVAIAGGCGNTAAGFISNIGGGRCNIITSSGLYSSIGSGKFNYNPLHNSNIEGGSFNHTGGFAPVNITFGANLSGNGACTVLCSPGIGSCFSASNTTGAVTLVWMTSGTANSTLSSACYTTANVVTNAANCIIINGDYSACRTGLSACSVFVYDRCLNRGGCTNFIGGGMLNTASGCYHTVVGGILNTINTSSAYSVSFIGGGCGNVICSNSGLGVIGGGGSNCLFGTGGGGVGNTPGFIGGGRGNCAQGNAPVIVGGVSNVITGSQQSVIGGGAANSVCCTSNYGNILGGCQNNICNSSFSFIGGGNCNRIPAGSYSSIVNGKFNYNPLFNSNIEGGSFNHTGGYTPANITFGANLSGNGACTVLIQSGIGSCFSASNTTGAVSLVWMTSGTANSTLSSACFTTANVVTNAANCIIINGDYSTCSTGFSACSVYVYDRCLNIGGCFIFIGGGMLNTASGNCGVIGGGFLNRATRSGASVLGGCQNSATGTSSTIVGGGSNTASAYYSAVIGGRSNNASGYTSIAGGWNNTVSGNYSSVGGRSSTVTGKGSSAVGGLCNTVSGNYSSIIGGINNTASGNYSFVASGSANNVGGTYSSIVGGFSNCINSGGGGNFIGGGCFNSTTFSCAVVVGGWCNTAGGVDVVVGGSCNTASANYSVVVGGVKNVANANCSFIAGGQCNHTNGFANTFILGSSLSASAANYTYVNNLSSQGVATVGGIITSNYAGAADSSVLLLGGNTKGGAGYNDFLRVYNPTGANSLWFRTNSVGGLEIIRSDYGQGLFTLTQQGNILVYGGTNATSSTSNDGLSGTLQFNNNNSQIYDDGNFHIHSRGNSQTMWINTNGGDIRIGQQIPVAGGSVANSVMLGGASNTSPTAYVNILGSKSYAISNYGYLTSAGNTGNISGSSGTVAFGLYVANRTQSGEVDVTSDERVKDIQGNISLEDAIKFIKNVNGIKYTWKEGFGDEGLKTGFGAQSVHKAGFEHMISHITNDKIEGKTDADGWVHPDKTQLSMGYNQVLPYHHEVIKSLLNRIEELEATVKQLRDK